MKLWFEIWSKTISKEKRKDIIRNPNGDFCVVQNIISFMKREICWIYWTLSSNFEKCYLKPLFQGVVANFWFLWSLVRSQWFGVFYNIYLFIIKMIQLLNPSSGFWGFGVYYEINNQSISVIEANTVSVTPNLSCSFSGTTSISYSISNYGLSTVPSWISVNSSSGALTIAAPSIDFDTEYIFYETSTVSGVSTLAQKIVKLTVKNWSAQNWEKCSAFDATIWSVWKYWYTLKDGSWVGVSNTAQIISTTTTSLIISSFGMIALISLF